MNLIPSHFLSVRGYALLDVVLAVALFAITATGLMQVMLRVSETSLAEKRKLGVEAMTSEMVDALTGITFRTFVEPYEVDNGEGSELTNLYRLTADATYTDDGGEQVEKAELIIYVPEP